MVKAADVNKDIKTIAEKVGTAVFSYNEIHNSEIKNNFHYDYQKVISEVSRLNGKDMTQELLEQGVLSPLPGGEYRVDVGNTTKGGGGINFGGTAFFSFSANDYQTKYHELAHSLQKHYGLFSAETVDKMYNDAETKLGGKEKAEGKLADRRDYKLYLNEMHSESFAFAALMLRAKGPIDFLYQTAMTYASGVRRNRNSLFNFRKPVYGSDNANTKYYTSYSVLKETIKRVWKIRLTGKTRSFFKSDGVIDDEKLAKFAEQTVIKGAYTPRTLNTLFKNKFFSRVYLRENGWRRDMIKSLLNKPVALIFVDKSCSPKDFKKHAALCFQEQEKMKEFVTKPYLGNDKEEEALLKYSQIMFWAREHLNKDDSLCFQSGVEILARINGCSENMKKYAEDRICKNLSSAVSEDNAGNIQPLLSFASKVIEENKDNPYFMALCKTMAPHYEVEALRGKKAKEPDESVLNLEELNNKAIDTGFGYWPIKEQLKEIAEFAEKYDKSGALRKNLEIALVQQRDFLEDDVFRAALVRDFAPKSRKEGFSAELKECMNSVIYTHLTNKDNPKYVEALHFLSEHSDENLRRLVRTKYEEEKERCTKKANAQYGEMQKSAQPKNDRKIIKKRQADLLKNNAALHKVLGMLDMIAQTADKHDTSGALKKDLQMAYLKNEDKMLSLEFWGKVVQKYATQSPEGKEACLKDISALGLKLGKDIKKNLNNVPSSVAKKYLCRREEESQKAKSVDQTNAAVKGKMLGLDGGR